jgi:transcriptional regulator with XRE-family HTH domain
MSIAKPGTALRRLRTQNHWTLADVSMRTGVPQSTLSRIENDLISPTYDLLTRLSSGLSIDLSELLADADAPSKKADELPGRRSVIRKGDGDLVQTPLQSLRYLSTDLLNKQMTPILSEYRARSLAEYGDFMRHPGEEFLYVLDGELELHTESYAPLVLVAGEAVYFDSRMGHAYIAGGVDPCRALSICTVPPHANHLELAHAISNPPPVPALQKIRRISTKTNAGQSKSPKRKPTRATSIA